jgi:hypothetical protein
VFCGAHCRRASGCTTSEATPHDPDRRPVVEAREDDDEAILNRALIQSRRRSARRYSRTRASGLLELTRRQPGQSAARGQRPNGDAAGRRRSSFAGRFRRRGRSAPRRLVRASPDERTDGPPCPRLAPSLGRWFDLQPTRRSATERSSMISARRTAQFLPRPGAPPGGCLDHRENVGLAAAAWELAGEDG